MRSLLTLAPFVLAFPSPGLAQDVVPATKLVPPAAAPLDDASEELLAILDEYDDALATFRVLFDAAEEAEKPALYEEHYPDPNDWAPRVLALADQYAGTPVACDALVWVASRTFGEHQEPALARLLADHFESERMAEVVFVLTRSKGGESNVRRLIAESPHRTVQGTACFALALTKERPRTGGEPWTARDEYVALMQRVASEFADVEFRGARLGPMAEGALFAMEHLQIGMPVPEIEGEDIAGVPFKLSDYRGKVVMLDFWGHW